jgi:hypothetical protein
MAFSLPPHSPAVDLGNRAAWLLPGDALARVQEVIGDRTIAIDTIVGRLRAGLLKAIYERWENTSKKYPLDSEFVSPTWWKHYKSGHESGYVWRTGDLRLYIGSVEGSLVETSVYLTFFRVKIEVSGIEEILANSTALPGKTSASQPKTENKGGAPRKEWWDDFWIEICRQIWIGDLKPKNQAGLVQAAKVI